MALRPTDAHLAVLQAGTAHTFTRIEIGTGHRTPDGTETALVTPFNPIRSKDNPPGVIDQATRAVDWVDGSTGDSVTYTASEAGLFATPAGGAEYLAAYDSHAVNDIFAKPTGNIISHRFLLLLSFAQLANATFNVAAVPQGTETIAGVVQFGDETDADADEASADATKAVSFARLWRWFTSARIVARLANNAITSAKIGSLDASKLTGTIAQARLPTIGIAKGGTGATDLAGAKTALEIGVEVVVHTTQTSYNNRSTTDGKLHIRVEP